MCSAGKRAAATAMWHPGNFRLGLELLHLLQLHRDAVNGIVLVAISAFGPNISRLPAIFRLPIVKVRAAVLIT